MQCNWRILASLAWGCLILVSDTQAASRLMGDAYTFSAMNTPGNLGVTEDPVTREVIDHGSLPAILTFDGVEEVAGGTRVNERVVEWPGVPGGIPAVQDATIDGMTEFDLVDWEFPGEVVEFSFKTVDGGWFADDVPGQSAITMRDLQWQNSEEGSLPEFFETGFYMYFSKDGVPAQGYSTILPEIGLLVGAHPFDETVSEVFYIAYSRGQVNEVTLPTDGGVDLTFGTSQLDENAGSWAALADVMDQTNLIGVANGLHIGFLVAPPIGSVVVVPGDVNGDGVFDVADFDAQGRAILAGSTDAKYDANGDGQVNAADQEHLVNSIGNTYFGDSNFDGEFNSGDLVFVFTAGEYEDGIAANSGWAEGDWDSNQEFDSSDFVIAFSAGGYELGPRAAVAAVPEPTSVALLVLGGLMMAVRARRV